MQRGDLATEVLDGWSRLSAEQRDRFFPAFVRASCRLDRLGLRYWLRRRLRGPPFDVAIELSRLTILQADLDAARKEDRKAR